METSKLHNQNFFCKLLTQLLQLLRRFFFFFCHRVLHLPSDSPADLLSAASEITQRSDDANIRTWDVRRKLGEANKSFSLSLFFFLPPVCLTESHPSRLSGCWVVHYMRHSPPPCSTTSGLLESRGDETTRENTPADSTSFCCRGLKGKCIPKSTTDQRSYHSSTPACGLMWRWRARTLRTDLPPRTRLWLSRLGRPASRLTWRCRCLCLPGAPLGI